MNNHFPSPRLPPEIQLHILPFGWELESIYDALPGTLRNNKMSLPPFLKFKPVALRTMEFFYTTSLVCQGWTTMSQQFLFSWITLFDASQLDKLFHNLRCADSSGRLLGYIQRISVRYSSPFFKFGEALPRIALLCPPNLNFIDLCPDGFGDIWFPFHVSLSMRLSRLGQVRTLHIRNLRFRHSTELRRLICSFPGVHSVDLNDLKIRHFGPDRLGEYRLLSLVGRPMSISCWPPMTLPAAAFPLTLWLTSPNCSDLWKHTVGIPTLSRGAAEFLASLRCVIASPISYYERWLWEVNVGGQVSNDEQWTLSACHGSTVTKSFTFRRKSYRGDIGSGCMARSRPSLDFIHLANISLAALHAVEGEDKGWDNFLLVVDTLISQGALCMNLETLELHFSSKPDSLPSWRYLQRLSDEERQKTCLPRILSSTEALHTNEYRYELDITLDGIPVNNLLHLLPKEKEEEANSKGDRF